MKAGSTGALQRITSCGVNDVALEGIGDHHDMGPMVGPRAYLALAMLLTLGIAPVCAQGFLPPGSNALTVPPPPAPPPPKIEVPVVPKMGDLPRQNYVPRARPSFGDRITNCLQDGAAAGLGPNERAAYSRACANR